MEKKPYNKIDDLFEKAFKEEQIPFDEAWGNPSDEVWERLLESGRADRKRRPILMYWRWIAIAASFVVLLLAGQTLYYNNQFKKQSEKIEAIEERLQEKLQEKIGNKEKYIAVEDKEDLDESEEVNVVNTVEEKIGKNKLDTYNSTELANKATKSTSTLSSTNTKKDRIFQEDKATTATSVAVDKQSFSSKDTYAIAKSSSVALLESTTPLLAEKNLELPINVISIPTEKKDATAYLSLNYNILESTQKLDQLPRRNIRFESEVEEKTLNIGLQFAYPLHPNWYIESGLRYSKSEAERTHRSATRFRKSNEQLNNNGQLESEYDLSLFSSEYTIESDLVLSRSNASSSIEEERTLNLSIITKNIVQQVQVPLLLAYQRQQNKFRWEVKTGLLANFRLQNRTTIEDIQIESETFQIDRFTAKELKPLLEKNSLEWNYYLSTAFSHQISTQLALQLEPYFATALQSRRSSNFFKSSTYAQSAGVRLGLSYSL